MQPRDHPLVRAAVPDWVVDLDAASAANPPVRSPPLRPPHPFAMARAHSARSFWSGHAAPPQRYELFPEEGVVPGDVLSLLADQQVASPSALSCGRSGYTTNLTDPTRACGIVIRVGLGLWLIHHGGMPRLVDTEFAATGESDLGH